MNDHLKPAFSIVAELEKSGIESWVYGGVGIAGSVGRFIRENKDIDVFVLESDIDRAKHVLNRLSIENHYRLESNKKGGRLKIKIIISGKERFSVIAVYETADSIVFKYPEKWGGDEFYQKQILERVERHISEFRFFTPPDKCIKEIFINHIKARPDKKSRQNFIADAKHILSPEELADLNWNI
jgi:hypothetical protein